MDERRPGEGARLELLERPRASLVVGRAPEHELERRADEVLVGALLGLDLGGDPGVHGQAYS